MAIKDDYNFDYLINESEKLVLDELEKQLAEYSKPLCRCNDCVVDIAALALNSVKPLYRASLMGRFYTSSVMDQRAYATSIREVVLKSIEKIRKNPSHDIIQTTI